MNPKVKSRLCRPPCYVGAKLKAFCWPRNGGTAQRNVRQDNDVLTDGISGTGGNESRDR